MYIICTQVFILHTYYLVNSLVVLLYRQLTTYYIYIYLYSLIFITFISVLYSDCRLASGPLVLSSLERNHTSCCAVLGMWWCLTKTSGSWLFCFIQSLFPRALALSPGATSLDIQSHPSLCIWDNRLLTLTYYPWPKLV